MSSETLLELVDVEKNFHGLTVLHDVNFTLAKGEILGLVGPNGSGKTTVINLISGVHRADAGSILLDGRAVQKLPSFRLVHLGINRTFQVPKPFKEMSVVDNIRVAAEFGGDSRQDVDAILDEIGLTAQRRQLAGGLTVNQQKMLDLGRALATNPRVLLVDEIGAGLNPSELTAMGAVLSGIAARGVALIVVEHLLDFLNRITRRVIVLGAGKMLFEGPLEAASKDPDVVAAFIGA